MTLAKCLHPCIALGAALPHLCLTSREQACSYSFLLSTLSQQPIISAANSASAFFVVVGVMCVPSVFH